MLEWLLLTNYAEEACKIKGVEKKEKWETLSLLFPLKWNHNYYRITFFKMITWYNLLIIINCITSEISNIPITSHYRECIISETIMLELL